MNCPQSRSGQNQCGSGHCSAKIVVSFWRRQDAILSFIFQSVRSAAILFNGRSSDNHTASSCRLGYYASLLQFRILADDGV